MNYLERAAVMAVFLTTLAIIPTPVAAQEKLKPFVLANEAAGDLAGTVADVKAKLQSAGFAIVGEHAPYDGTYLIVVSDDELRKTAAKTKHGGFGAAQRVSVAKVGDKVQVAYANPAYWAAAFRMDGNLAAVGDKLKRALGAGSPFGAAAGLTDKELRGYHYMMMMPYFDDVNRLTSAGSHGEMIARVEEGLAARKGGVTKVYRVDIPGKEETVFGVTLAMGDGADKNVMGVVDFGPLKHAAHLPYDLLVSGKDAYALDGKFRIALSWPDLTMGTFMRINDAPDAIRDALALAAGRGR